VGRNFLYSLSLKGASISTALAELLGCILLATLQYSIQYEWFAFVQNTDVMEIFHSEPCQNSVLYRDQPKAYDRYLNFCFIFFYKFEA
jgi:hypothetical protein